MNLKQALQRGKLKQFAKERGNTDRHPIGNERFDALMDAMVKGKPSKPEAPTLARNPKR